MSASPDALAVLHGLRVPPFEPTPWLYSGHAQTAAITYLSAGPDADRGERVRIPIQDGVLAGRLHRAPGTPARAAVLVLHGIAGSASETFVQRTARRCNARGLDALRLDLRGAGESHACGPAPLYHAGLTDDVRAALGYLAERYDRVHAVGFSLGGQLVLRACGEWARNAPASLASVTSISAPLDLDPCARYADRPAAFVYRWVIVQALKARFAAAVPALGPGFSHETVRAVRTLREFDAAVVAPLFGFRDVDEYYERASSGAVLEHIAAPTLVLHAHDDPIVPIAPVLSLRARGLPQVRVETPSRGGHIAFVGRRPAAGDATRFWAEERAVDLAAALS